ncbi:MAG: hypothetical protein IMW97_08645 [Firmicutes bacterium]|nr:hypothetical protein [Candidatus Fermentithermobacillaceae bacterium]
MEGVKGMEDLNADGLWSLVTNWRTGPAGEIGTTLRTMRRTPPPSHSHTLYARKVLVASIQSTFDDALPGVRLRCDGGGLKLKRGSQPKLEGHKPLPL